jgi:cell division protein FtsQ
VRHAAALTLRTLPRAAALVPRAAAHVPPRLRRRLVALAAVVVLLAAAYIGWFRDSGLVAVERVEVTGLTTRDEARVRAALTEAARDMTTLHVRHGELEQAVAGFRVVRTLEVQADFPHRLTIRVVEHRPAALVATRSGRVPVAADGTVLSGLPVEGRLPVLEARGAATGGRLTDERALRSLRVIGAAPGAIAARVLRVDQDREAGVVVRLRRGPRLLFGDLTRLGAKWAAATRVLADAQARGATYVDVRLPERPAAGGLAEPTIEPVAPAGGASAGTGSTGAPAQQGTGSPDGAQVQQQSGAGAGPPEAPAGSAPQTGAPPAAPPQAPAAPGVGAGGGVPANTQP